MLCITSVLFSIYYSYMQHPFNNFPVGNQHCLLRSTTHTHKNMNKLLVIFILWSHMIYAMHKCAKGSGITDVLVATEVLRKKHYRCTLHFLYETLMHFLLNKNLGGLELDAFTLKDSINLLFLVSQLMPLFLLYKSLRMMHSLILIICCCFPLCLYKI